VGIKSVDVSPAEVDRAGLELVRTEGADPDGGVVTDIVPTRTEASWFSSS
jgi:hypothetical protein